MGIIATSSNLFFRKQDFLTSISISMLISLAYNPFVIYNIGFCLSYLGTIGIVLFINTTEKMLSKKLNNKIAKMLAVSISAGVLIVPINAYVFNRIPILFLISNFLASPIVCVLIILGFITIIVSFISFKLAKTLAIVLNIFLKVLSLIAKTIAEIPFSNILVVTPFLISIIFSYVLIMLLRYIYIIHNSKRVLKQIERKILYFLKSKTFHKFLVSILVIILILNLIFLKIPKKLKIYFVDVGQGDCTLIVTPNNKKILIDGGEKNNILVSYLLDRRIRKLDYIIISHFDSDHIRSVY